MTTEITLDVPDISCAHCKSAIEGAVAPMSGVETAEVAIDARTVHVRFDEAAVNLSAIVSAIEDQGYDVAR